MTTYVICGVITLAALFYVFYIPAALRVGPEQTRAMFLRERKDAAYENLRDLNFEYKAGKVPEADYANMKQSLEDEAAGLLAQIEDLESATRQKGKI